MNEVTRIPFNQATDDLNVDAPRSPDPHIVDFDGTNDVANPLNWSDPYKWCLVALISVMSLVV